MLQYLSLAFVASYLGTIAFATVFGGRAERLGAGVLALGLIVTWVTQVLVGQSTLAPYAGIDLLVTLGFAAIAARYPDKLWPGMAGCAMLLVFVFTATRVIDFPLGETSYFVAKNLSGFGTLLALSLGTWAQRWHQRPPSDWDLAYDNLQQSGPQNR